MESWLRDIEGARNEAEVVRHARDYCALLHPRDLAPLETGIMIVLSRAAERLAELRATST